MEASEQTIAIDRDLFDLNAQTLHIGTIKPASDDMVSMVLGASEDGNDGRSNFVWVRLIDGTLILGVFPQGDTYLECEGEAP